MQRYHAPLLGAVKPVTFDHPDLQKIYVYHLKKVILNVYAFTIWYTQIEFIPQS